MLRIEEKINSTQVATNVPLLQLNVFPKSSQNFLAGNADLGSTFNSIFHTEFAQNN